MPVCSSGSQPKPATPAVIFLAGEALTALVSGTLLTPIWADVVAYAAATSFTSTVLCAGDPPTMPSFTASDVTEIILNTNPFLETTGTSKLNDLIEIAAWYAFCECISGGTPAPPAAPTYPTGAPTINPPGGTPGPTTQGCAPAFAQQDSIAQFLAITFVPNVPVDSSGYATAPNGATSITFQVQNITQGARPADAIFEYFVDDPTHTTHYAHVTNASVPNGTTQTFTVAIPPNVEVIWACEAYENTAMTTSTNQLQLNVSFNCQSGSGCCPPDPSVVATLQQIMAGLNLIYSALPSPVNSYADGTAHAALSGSGNFALGVGALAIKLEVTTLPIAYSEYAGDPTRYLELGWVTFETDAAPFAPQQIAFQTQFYSAPPLATAVHYTLPPGAVVTITEVTAGP